MDPAECNSGKQKIGYNTFCVRGLKEQTICQGDSGGPVIWEDKNDMNRAYLIGIASKAQSVGCGNPPNSPSIFALIPAPNVLDWIVKFDYEHREIIDCLHENGPI